MAVALVLGVLAILVLLLRSLKIAQLEHYLAGSVGRTVARWYAVLPLNILGLLVVLALGVASLFVNLSAVGYSFLAVASVLIAVLPFALSLRRLELAVTFTRRLDVVAAISTVLVVVLVLVVGSLPPVSWPFAVWSGAVLTPLLVDLALVAAAPIEAVISEKYANAAAEALRRVGPKVVAITGSFGKTTTKEYLATLLAGVTSVVPSPASFNNKAGLSRAVSERLEPGTDVFVAEMGTYGPGEIQTLCRYFPPDVSVFTAIGPVHLERMRTIEAIVRAKSEILRPGKPAVINVDYPELAALAAAWKESRVITVGTARVGDPRPDLVPDVVVIPGADGFDIEIGGDRHHAPHSDAPSLDASNLACAIGAVVALDLDPALVMDNVARIERPRNRRVAEVAPGGYVVIDDTFNSNPVGARAATAELARRSPDGASVVVTPGMVELGPQQNAENERWIAESAGLVDRLVVVGHTNRRALLRGAKAAGIEARAVAKRESAVTSMRTELSAGDGVLYENDLPVHYP